MEHYCGSLFESCFEKQNLKKLEYKKGINMPALYCCFYLTEKNAHEVTLEISPTIYGKKENYLNELENIDDSEIINFSNLAVRFNLRNI